MKIYVTAILLAGCYRAPITYAGGSVTPPQITCVYCDTLPKNVTADGGLNVYGDSVKLGGVIEKSAWTDASKATRDTMVILKSRSGTSTAQDRDGIGNIADFGMLSDGNIVWDRDSSVEWIYKRLQEITDSIRIVYRQNAWLDSLNNNIFDTVKWTPYYYKPKKKK